MSNLELLNATVYVEKLLCSITLILFGIWFLQFLKNKKLDSFKVNTPQKKLEGWLTPPFYPRNTLLYQLENALTPSREIGIMVLIFSGALFSRLFGWDQALNAPNWFAQVTPIYIADLIEKGNIWQQWLDLLSHFQLAKVHQSALQMPVALMIQRLWGPSIHLPVLVGAFWGLNAVILAWLLGRTCHSKVFGLLFAAFLVVSPLQIVWSRTGGIFIGSTTHVLLVVWLSYLAGKRKSYWLTLLAGIATWSCLYQYYAARVALPLAFIALFSGLLASRAKVLKMVTLLTGMGLVLCAVYLLTSTSGFKETIWPEYGGYTGNKGEVHLSDYITYNLDSTKRELQRAIRLYFLNYRSISTLPEEIYKWGMESGGICFAPVALLGIVGLIRVFKYIRQDFLWLLLIASGLALPVLSITTPRRLLIFDLAWCALAAHGLVFLMDSKFFRSSPLPTMAAALGTFFILLGGWSFTSIVLLNKVLPDHYQVSIPFGDVSWFKDGRVCRRCLEAGYQWEEQIKEDNFIILVDSDLNREGRTIPGGLSVYGKLAALAVGKKDYFLELYSVLQNNDLEPPIPGKMYDNFQMDFVQYLDQKIRHAQPDHIIWHFEQPTQWERWLATRLTSIGGKMTLFNTPIQNNPGVQVRISWDQWKPTRRMLQELYGSEAQETVYLDAKLVDISSRKKPPIILAVAPVANNDPLPHWVMGSWEDIQYLEKSIPVLNPVGVSLEYNMSSNSQEIHILTKEGHYLKHKLSNGTQTYHQIHTNNQIGLGCAVFLNEHWWFVDSIKGVLYTTSPLHHSIQIPTQDLIGIKVGKKKELLLASASQRIYIYDLERKTITDDFSASVWPSRKLRAGECAPLLSGKDWYATYDHFQSRLHLYGLNGKHLTTVRLDRLLNLHAENIISLEEYAQYLGVGLKFRDEIQTFRIRLQQINRVPIKIPDAHLEACLRGKNLPFRSENGLSLREPITDELIYKATNLECGAAGITDVDILKEFRHLRILNLSENQIKKVDASGLVDLEKLILSGNRLTEIQGLQDLKDLQMLWLGYNQLTFLDLTGLTQLRDLRIDGNRFTRIEGISTLKNLERVYLGGNPRLNCDTLHFPNPKTEIHGC